MLTVLVNIIKPYFVETDENNFDIKTFVKDNVQLIGTD